MPDFSYWCSAVRLPIFYTTRPRARRPNRFLPALGLTAGKSRHDRKRHKSILTKVWPSFTVSRMRPPARHSMRPHFKRLRKSDFSESGRRWTVAGDPSNSTWNAVVACSLDLSHMQILNICCKAEMTSLARQSEGLSSKKQRARWEPQRRVPWLISAWCMAFAFLQPPPRVTAQATAKILPLPLAMGVCLHGQTVPRRLPLRWRPVLPLRAPVDKTILLPGAARRITQIPSRGRLKVPKRFFWAAHCMRRSQARVRPHQRWIGC